MNKISLRLLLFFVLFFAQGAFAQSLTLIEFAPRTYWKHCSQPLGYFPHVRHCPAGWEIVPATDITPPVVEYKMKPIDSTPPNHGSKPLNILVAPPAMPQSRSSTKMQ